MVAAQPGDHALDTLSGPDLSGAIKMAVSSPRLDDDQCVISCFDELGSEALTGRTKGIGVAVEEER